MENIEEPMDKIDYEQASRMTGIKKPTLYAMVSQKRIPHFRLGGRLVRFSRSELGKWVQDRYIPENLTETDRETH